MEAKPGFEFLISSVHSVSNNRMIDVSAVNSKLVCTTSYRFQLNQRCAGESIHNLEFRLCRLALIHNAPLRFLILIATDRGFYRARFSVKRAAYQSKITLLHKSLSKMARQDSHSPISLRDYHQAGGVAVEPVNQTRTNN